MNGTKETDKCMKGDVRVRWIDSRNKHENGWTRSSTIRPMSRPCQPGRVDWVYYSPDGVRLTSKKRAQAYMDGTGVKQTVKIPDGGTHIRWQYRDDELN